MDELAFMYEGSQLIKTKDASTYTYISPQMEFRDNADQAREYAYDINGNMTKDLNKKIVNIKYNVLHLPNLIEYEDGSEMEYLYAADGGKLSTSFYAKGDTGSLTTDYVGNMVYENGSLKRILI